ncbi:MAG: MgtC/SapB family protein [Pseudomonadota bacterium]
MARLEDFLYLGLALGIGLLIGLERGWHEREAAEGTRVAGFRTIGLIGLIGGVLGLLAARLGGLVLAGGFIGVAAVLGIGYWHDVRLDKNVSVTTVMAALLAISLGALATLGYPRLAASAAVIAALVLHLKPALHGLVRRIDEEEIRAVLRFLLISVVILPLLPNQGYGPYQALNPTIIWWMVVLISGISFAGYVAVKAWGARRGLILTAAVGALVSSTAITLAYAREARRRPQAAPLFAAGIVLASTIMVGRMAVVATLIAPALGPMLLLFLSPMALAGLGATLLLAPGGHDDVTPDYKLANPFELRIALFFGLGLGLILLGARFLEARFGDTGLYAIALVTGLFDVDAMTVSASQMTRTGLALNVAAVAITLAGISNSVAKPIMGIAIGGRALLIRLGLAFAAMVVAGLLTLAVWAGVGGA